MSMYRGRGGGGQDRGRAYASVVERLYGEVQCIIGNGHMGPAVNRLTVTSENITFL